MTGEIRNAEIKSIHLGPEDHGIMTLMVRVEGDGWGQGCGGFSLGGGDAMLRAVSGLLAVCGKDNLMKCVGVIVRHKGEAARCSIGHVTKDIWWDGLDATGKADR